MVENTLRMADPSVPIRMVHTSRGNIIIYGMTMSCGICCRAAIRPAIAQFILSDLKEQFFLSDYKEFRDLQYGASRNQAWFAPYSQSLAIHQRRIAMAFDRDEQVEALSREIWQLMEVRAAELRQLGCNSGFIQGLWRDTLAHLTTELSARARVEHWDDEDE